MNGPARMTVLAAWVADQHEHLGPTCLYAADGDTCCTRPATHRIELAAGMPGYPHSGPVTFTCAQHLDQLRDRPDLTLIREVTT